MKVPNTSLRCRCFVAVLVLVVLTGVGKGAIYELSDEWSNSGWIAAVNEDWDIGITVDAVRDDAVVIQIQKRFVGDPDDLGLMPPMYIEFIKDSEEALEKIIISDEFITNDTSVDWIDFHIELAVSIFDPEAGFGVPTDPSGDQFETVIVTGTNGYNGLPTKIDFYDGVVPEDPPDQDDFRPGWHSGYITIIANPEMEVGQRILLKEYPTIPEPATLFVMLAAGLPMLLRNRRRRGPNPERASGLLIGGLALLRRRRA